MGAGDVKLFAAVGALVGPQALVLIFVLTGLCGGLAAVAAMLRRRKTIPYGAVIAVGTLTSLIVL
jgi:Flp pilus assembly protein protease CpaA